MLCGQSMLIKAGKVYALGAEGDLLCLDAGSGEIQWQRNVLEEFQGEHLRWGVSTATRHQADAVRRTYRILSGMLLVALLAGLTLFVVQITGASDSGGLPSATHMKIGIKFLLFLGVGGCVGLQLSELAPRQHPRDIRDVRLQRLRGDEILLGLAEQPHPHVE